LATIQDALRGVKEDISKIRGIGRRKKLAAGLYRWRGA
jgi:hypothetical protein